MGQNGNKVEAVMFYKIVLLLRLTYLVVSFAIAAVALFSPSLKKLFLAYGKTSTRRDKGGLRTSLASYVTSFSVSKRRFRDFYLFSFLWNLMLLYLAFLTPIFPFEHNHIFVSTKTDAVVGYILLQVHVFRRYFEELFLFKKSDAQILVLHYLGSLAYYAITGVSIWIEALADFAESDIVLLPRHFIIVFLFLIFSYIQWKSHLILARLRINGEAKKKYSIPRGHWFEWLIVPHYTAEIFIYLTICAATQSVTMCCCCVFVVVNLTTTAVDTKKWYHRRFKEWSKEEEKRWIILPGVF